MFVNKNGLSVAELSAALPDASHHLEKRHRSPLQRRSDDGCGCCPICHAFVHAEFTQAGHLATCPACGGLVDSLDALGAPPSK
jgi:hypothetical protein